MNEFRIKDKKITVYGEEKADHAVWLNTFSGEGKAVYERLCGEGLSGFSLIAVSGLDWNRELSPWEAAPFGEEEVFGGGGGEYLRFLTAEIMPKILEKAELSPKKNIIAGYSLGGLFALWAMYKTEVFSAAASMSGSLWFPGFSEFAKERDFTRSPDCVYLSLGDREHYTADPYLSTVQEKTEELFAGLCSRNIKAVYELNKGGHGKNAIGRTARGIEWVLRQYRA